MSFIILTNRLPIRVMASGILMTYWWRQQLPRWPTLQQLEFPSVIKNTRVLMFEIYQTAETPLTLEEIPAELIAFTFEDELEFLWHMVHNGYPENYKQYFFERITRKV